MGIPAVLDPIGETFYPILSLVDLLVDRLLDRSVFLPWNRCFRLQ
jgi:hypothetical protein